MKKNNQTRQSVMEEIKKGRIKMRSQLSIWAEKLGLGSGALLLILSLIFLTSAIMYWLKSNQDLVLGGYFPRFGIKPFIESLPYLLIMLFISLFVLLNLLLKKYDFSYKKPFILILSGLLGMVILAGALIYNHPGPLWLFKRSPKMFKLRQSISRNFVIGQIIKINSNNLELRTIEQKSILVLINEKTFYPSGKVKINDHIRAVGEWEMNRFRAFAIANLEPGKPRFNNQPMQMQKYAPNFKRTH